MPLYLVYINHRNRGFSPWSTCDDRDKALSDLEDCADHWEEETIKRFGDCDREEDETNIYLGDTGTVSMREIPEVGEAWG